MKQSFSWFIDLATSTTDVQMVGIKAGGLEVYKRLMPFFTAYKHFKLGPISIKMVPAATLPVDPTGLSYEAGESTVDPRDQLNPGLVRIINGEDMPTPPDTTDMNFYYGAMLDRRWFKFNLQSGFKRRATPLAWNVGEMHQDAWPGAWLQVPPQSVQIGQSTAALETDMPGYLKANVPDPSVQEIDAAYRLAVGEGGMTPYSLIQTGRVKLGWMPTDMCQMPVDILETGLNRIPEVNTIMCILPKAYKTKFYYRVYVTETVYFKDPVAINPYFVPDNTAYGYAYPPIDRTLMPSAMAIDPTSEMGGQYHKMRKDFSDVGSPFKKV